MWGFSVICFQEHLWQHLDSRIHSNTYTLVKTGRVSAAAKLLQSCPTLCDPIDRGPPGSPRPWDSPGKNTGVGCHFLLQCMKVKSESEAAQSCPTLATPWTAAHQAPPSMGFSRQEYWSQVPLPSLEESLGVHKYIYIYIYIYYILYMFISFSLIEPILRLGDQGLSWISM